MNSVCLNNGIEVAKHHRKSNSIILILLSVGLLFSTSSASGQVRYRISTLYPIDGFQAKPTTINNFGLVAGAATNLATGGNYDVAAVWSDDGIARHLTGEGLSGALVNAVNDNGLMAGISDSLAFNGFTVGLGLKLSELEGIAPRDIDSSGNMVGVTSNQPGGDVAAFYENGKINLLPQLEPGFQIFANAMNDAGVIVGLSDTASGPILGVVWGNGAPRVLNGIEGADNSWFEISRANDINESSTIVGVAFINSFVRRAAVWKQSDDAELLPISAGDEFASSVASAINDNGVIVGQSNVAGVANSAVVWRDGAIQNLNDLIDPNSGWTLTNATDINNRGQIVGWGYLDDQQLGFRLNLLGDINLDSKVDLLDVQPFVALLTSGGSQLEADINQDGALNLLDVSFFVELLTAN